MFTIAFSLLLILITIMMIRVIIKSMMIISYRGTSLKWPYESSLSSSSSSLSHDRQNHDDHDDHCKSAFDRERHSDGRYGAVGTSISQHQAHWLSSSLVHHGSQYHLWMSVDCSVDVMDKDFHQKCQCHWQWCQFKAGQLTSEACEQCYYHFCCQPCHIVTGKPPDNLASSKIHWKVG